ncbi:prophage antirepressor-like protein [Variovorax boronicumulans]|uniref:BRO-N domain-containing protein n=1 Tax=Variovorax boronicumulans TaxID=436515 RepID=UPI002472F9CC|nr:Bro-N domain-containing protein [Variovorax boronicumulans]MDH6166075.1 prophage antirepressor-like protein [Variovorax boronicumulans]
MRGFSDAAGAFWFVTLDVLPAMGLRGGPKIIPRIDHADKAVIGKGNAYGMHPDTTVINESGMYTLASLSRKPEAKEFLRWLASHVQPTLHILRLAARRNAA